MALPDKFPANPSDELLAKVMEKVERIEVGTILPDDVLILHFPAATSVDDAEATLESVAMALGGQNPVIGFIIDVRVEIKHHESSGVSMQPGVTRVDGDESIRAIVTEEIAKYSTRLGLESASL